MSKSRADTVVVAFDGSPCAQQAVRWAEEYAKLTASRLLIVTAWHMPPSYGGTLTYRGFDPEVDARNVAEKAVADLSMPPDRFGVEVARGAAGQVLVEASKDARLLVLGKAGHGAPLSTMLGSTSMHCVNNAECPVVVVR